LPAELDVSSCANPELAPREQEGKLADVVKNYRVGFCILRGHRRVKKFLGLIESAVQEIPDDRAETAW
jgi:hypothetical protein